MSHESYKTLYLYFVSIVITGDNKLTFTRQTRGNKSREQLSETLSLVTSPQRRRAAAELAPFCHSSLDIVAVISCAAAAAHWRFYSVYRG